MSLQDLNVFVTGGLGFIASHTAMVLIGHGAKVTLMDNLSNSFLSVFESMKVLAGDRANRMKFIKLDLNDKEGLDQAFAAEKYDAVIHFASYKAVGESFSKPLEYYRNNFCGTITLLEVLRKHEVKTVVFSSSATVYGLPDKVPVTEESPLSAINPYGRTKLFLEEVFRDISACDPTWRITLLRYFNPTGAHPSGDLGEHPVGVPNNLMPYIMQVALGQREYLSVYGGDYETPDGSGIRDYIHVMDLAEGHAAALRKLMSTPDYGCKPINLGTGKGSSVLEMVKAFEAASGKQVAYKVVDRRPGDSPAVWAATEFAEKDLGWKAQFGVPEMCADLWRWASKHPHGYETQ